MKEDENSLSPEALDMLTERSSSRLPQEERRLVQNFYTFSQEYARENERSLERIWNRFVQSQEHSAVPQDRQQEKPEGKLLFIEGKAMQENDFRWPAESSTLHSQPMRRSRRSFARTLSISVAAAVVLITILSWALLSSLHKPGTLGSSNNGNTPQKAISHGTLLCSFSNDNNTLEYPRQPSLHWSSRGQLATTYDNLKIVDAQSCSQKSSQQTSYESATWSPDGKRLLVFASVDSSDYQKASIIDASTGKVIATFKIAQQASIQHQSNGVVPLSAFSGGAGPYTGFGPSMWSADGTQIISVVSVQGEVTVQLWNASTGAPVRTLFTVPGTLGTDAQPLNLLSPDGKYLAVQFDDSSIQIWSIDSGKRVSTIPFEKGEFDFMGFPSAVAWSPDGTSLALGLTNASKVQIWSTATAQLIASFTDTDASAHVIGALAWSPDGKYLAESGSDIHIWDVKAQKFVATFGKVDPTRWTATLAWSPDSRMLVSATNGILQKGKITENKINVWKLA